MAERCRVEAIEVYWGSSCSWVWRLHVFVKDKRKIFPGTIPAGFPRSSDDDNNNNDKIIIIILVIVY